MLSVGQSIFVVIQIKLPLKCEDRGIFTISYTIGNVGITKTMWSKSFNKCHAIIYLFIFKCWSIKENRCCDSISW